MPFWTSKYPPAPSYNSVILADGPVGFWDESFIDQTANGNNATITGTPTTAVLPNGDLAMRFNGTSQYVTIPDQPYFSAATHANGGASPGGVLTIEAWIAPAVTIFPNQTGTGYVWWSGKGTNTGFGGNQEWATRMYGTNNSESPNRWNRISGYAFNPVGGDGDGAYFQVPAAAPIPVAPFPQWIYYVLTIVAGATPADGYVTIWRGSVGAAIGTSAPVNENTQSLDQPSVAVVTPVHENAPVRVGTRDLESYFEGAVGKYALYDYELTAAQVAAHYQAMSPPAGAGYRTGPAAIGRSAAW